MANLPRLILKNRLLVEIQPAACSVEIASIDNRSSFSEGLEQIQNEMTEDNDAELPQEPHDADTAETGDPIEQTSSQTMLDEALEYCRTAHNLRQQGKLDEALKALDQAYILIMDVNTDDFPGLMQQKEVTKK